ncbi:hypothetical protein Mapa_000873 [Marchantia paleacea]|nr:hypothetical protein Mapa_000873 [Marchantia paleacea]
MFIFSTTRIKRCAAGLHFYIYLRSYHYWSEHVDRGYGFHHGKQFLQFSFRHVTDQIANEPMVSNLDRTSPLRASIFKAASSSARVGPMLTIPTGDPRSIAARINRKTDMTINDDPTAKTASLDFTNSMASSALALGTLSPKNTTSGFKTPPHCSQAGTRKSSWKNLLSISMSPSGRCFIPNEALLPGSPFSRASTATAQSGFRSQTLCWNMCLSLKSPQPRHNTLCVVP